MIARTTIARVVLVGRIALVGMGAVAMTACSSAPAGFDAAAAPAPVSTRISPRFRPALKQIGTVQRAMASSNTAQTNAAVTDLLELGVALVQARMPHDVARPDVPRYNAARQAFGEALKEVTYARDSNDSQALGSALTRLDGATRRWSEAHLGLAPETSL